MLYKFATHSFCFKGWNGRVNGYIKACGRGFIGDFSKCSSNGVCPFEHHYTLVEVYAIKNVMVEGAFFWITLFDSWVQVFAVAIFVYIFTWVSKVETTPLWRMRGNLFVVLVISTFGTNLIFQF